MRKAVKIFCILLALAVTVAMFATQLSVHALFALDNTMRRSSLEQIFNEVLLTDILKRIEYTPESTAETGDTASGGNLYDAVALVFNQAGFDAETTDKMLNSASMRTIFYEVVFGAYVGIVNNNEENFVTSAELGVLIEMNLDGILEASGTETDDSQKALLQVFMTMLLSEVTDDFTLEKVTSNENFSKYYERIQTVTATRNRYTLISVTLVLLLLLFALRWGILRALSWAGAATLLAGVAAMLIGNGVLGLEMFIPGLNFQQLTGTFYPIAEVFIENIKALLLSYGKTGALLGGTAILVSMLQLVTKNKHKSTVIISG